MSVLIVCLLGFIIFDAYIFVFRTEVPKDSKLNDGGEKIIRVFSKKLLDDAMMILQKRTDTLGSVSATSTPTRDPFNTNVEIRTP